MNRIQVKGRRFGYRSGELYTAFKEYRVRGREGPLLSFAVLHERFFDDGERIVIGPVDRKRIRALILQRMDATKECE
jgi:hypothetical protein